MAKKSGIFAQVGFLGTCIVAGAASLSALPGSLIGLGFLGAGILVAGGGGAMAGALVGGVIDIATDIVSIYSDPIDYC